MVILCQTITLFSKKLFKTKLESLAMPNLDFSEKFKKAVIKKDKFRQIFATIYCNCWLKLC